MPPKINKEEFDQIVQRAITAANEALAKELTEDLGKQIDIKCIEVITEMRSENMELRAHIANLEQKLSDQGKVVSTLETKL